jgi:hypothetical protein
MASTPVQSQASSTTTVRHDRRERSVTTGSAETRSRAIRPPVVVSNRRLPINAVGESYLVYRCIDCGAVGHLTAFPTTCGECAAGRESLYYEIED